MEEEWGGSGATTGEGVRAKEAGVGDVLLGTGVTDRDTKKG